MDEKEQLSLCCGAPVITCTDDICSKCREPAGFKKEESWQVNRTTGIGPVYLKIDS